MKPVDLHIYTEVIVQVTLPFFRIDSNANMTIYV